MFLFLILILSILSWMERSAKSKVANQRQSKVGLAREKPQLQKDVKGKCFSAVWQASAMLPLVLLSIVLCRP